MSRRQGVSDKIKKGLGELITLLAQDWQLPSTRMMKRMSIHTEMKMGDEDGS